MPLYKRGEVWWIDLRHGGRRTRRSTGTTDRQAAKRQHDELATRLHRLKAQGRTLADALLAWHQSKTRAPSAARTLRQVRAEYPDRPLGDVTEASLAETWGHLSPGTYNKLAGTVRAALNIAAARGWVETAPKIARRAEPTVEPRYLTAEEAKRLLAELPDHLRPMVAFALATGLRWANVSGLTWDRVSLERKVAWIPASTAKARRTIHVPLSAAALAALRDAQGPRTGFVFTYRGKPLGSPKTAWRKAALRAGVPWFTFHGTRHTWASWHAMAGTPLDVLQRLGGWETRDMVQRYAHLAPSYVARFAGNAKPVSGSVATKLDTARKRKGGLAERKPR